jgi:hypothetical protein
MGMVPGYQFRFGMIGCGVRASSFRAGMLVLLSPRFKSVLVPVNKRSRRTGEPDGNGCNRSDQTE